MPVFDTGFLSPTTNGTPATYDGPATEYINPSNAYADDGNYASVTDNEYSYKYQSYGGFGFSIPESSIILGVEIVTKGKTDVGVELDGLLLYNHNSGDYYSISNQFFSPTEVSHTYGGSTELFGFSWSPQSFNSNFWVIHFTGGGNNARIVSLNNIKVKVYYDTTNLNLNINDPLSVSENVSNDSIRYSSDNRRPRWPHGGIAGGINKIE